jgi:transcriptional regulator with XRE-family HTH domain
MDDGRAEAIPSMTVRAPASRPIGELLRGWRHRRRFSQLQLAVASGVSARHVSFVECGRSHPSREMILHLAASLDVPLRERNALLLAAGFSPAYAESSLDAPLMAPIRAALDQLLSAHDPFPAVVVDRYWNLVLANAGVLTLVEGIDDRFLKPPINVMRATLHPAGLAPHIENFGEYSRHLLHRLRRQIFLTGDPELEALFGEMVTYPGVQVREDEDAQLDPTEIVLPIRLRSGARILSFFTMISTFGTALDLTLADLALESFFPADDLTNRVLREGRGDAE